MAPTRPRSSPAPYGAALVLLGLIPVACADAEAGGGWAGTVDTLPGGALVVRSPATGAWSEAERWRLEEDLRLGTLDGEGPEQFGAPSDVAVDGEGRLWILDRDAKEVRVFTASGEHVRTLGRPGGGPGELASPWSVTFAPNGRLWIQDVGNRRYEIFDTAGRHVRSERMRGLAFSGGDVWGPDGRFYQMVNLPRQGMDLERALVAHALEGDSLVAQDTLVLPMLQAGETVDVTWQAGGVLMRMRRPIPFSHPPQMRLAPDGAIWLTAGGGDYRILHLAGADTVKIVERAYDPVPVPDSAIDAALERLGPQGASADLDRGRIPRVHPPFDSFMVDDGGVLWVRRHTAPDRVGYDVFDADGRYLGEVESDADLSRFNLLEITGDALYGVLPDALDVPYMVRLRVVRPAGS